MVWIPPAAPVSPDLLDHVHIHHWSQCPPLSEETSLKNVSEETITWLGKKENFHSLYVKCWDIVLSVRCEVIMYDPGHFLCQDTFEMSSMLLPQRNIGLSVAMIFLYLETIALWIIIVFIATGILSTLITHNNEMSWRWIVVGCTCMVYYILHMTILRNIVTKETWNTK